MSYWQSGSQRGNGHYAEAPNGRAREFHPEQSHDRNSGAAPCRWQALEDAAAARLLSREAQRDFGHEMAGRSFDMGVTAAPLGCNAGAAGVACSSSSTLAAACERLVWPSHAAPPAQRLQDALANYEALMNSESLAALSAEQLSDMHATHVRLLELLQRAEWDRWHTLHSVSS